MSHVNQQINLWWPNCELVVTDIQVRQLQQQSDAHVPLPEVLEQLKIARLDRDGRELVAGQNQAGQLL